MTAQQKRVVKVLENIIDSVKKDEDDAKVYSDCLEDMLDGLFELDWFGTEGQNDPRGDQRDDEWSMGYVQGIDD